MYSDQATGHSNSRELFSSGVCYSSWRYRVRLCLNVIVHALFLAFVVPACADLKHRYTFNDGAADDSIGGSHGEVVDPAGILTIAQGQADLTLNDGARSNQRFFTDPDAFGGYINLPNNIFTDAVQSGVSGQITIELWATVEENRDWARLVDFGTKDDGEDAPTSGAQNSEFVNIYPQSVRQAFGANTRTFGRVETLIEDTSPLPTDVEHHIVYTLDAFDDAGGLRPNGTRMLYLNNQLVGTAEIVPGLDIATMVNNNNWLGRSQFRDPLFDGLYNEVNIYDHALTEQDVASRFFTGPVSVLHEWIHNGSGSWNSPSNWLRDEPPFSTDAHVLFGDTISAPTNVQLTSNASAERIEFASLHPYTISADDSQSLELTGFADVVVERGVHTIDATISGSSGLFKFGPGTLVLTGHNAYFGETFIFEGEVFAGTPTALGDPLDTFGGAYIDRFGGQLTLGELDVFSENLRLEGRDSVAPHVVNQGVNTLTGEVELLAGSGPLHTFEVDSKQMEFSGPIRSTAGPATLHVATAGGAQATFSNQFNEEIGRIGLLKTGQGDATIFVDLIGESGLYTGPTDIQAGVLRVQSGLTATATQELRSDVITVGALGTLDISAFFDYELDPSQTLTGDGVVEASRLFVPSTAAIQGRLTIRGEVITQGRVAPGFSPGILRIDGEYTQESGVLEIEIGGLIPGEQHDQLVVTDFADLAGGLVIPILDGFVPTADDEIVIITTGGGVFGEFNTIVSPNLADVNPNLALDVVYQSDDVLVRFANVASDSQFNSTASGSSWHDPVWSDGVPGATSAVDLQAQTIEAQTVRVIDQNAFAHQLNVGANIIFEVQNGLSLSATTGVTVSDQGQVLLINNGALATSEVAVARGGFLGGNGRIAGNVVVGTGPGATLGVLSPGLSVGSITIEGDYLQTESGQLVIEVEGADAGEFDTLQVGGNVEFGGELLVVVPDELAAPPGTLLEVLTAGSFTEDAVFQRVVTEGADDIYFAPIYSNAFPPGVAAAVGGGFGLGSYPEGDMNRDFAVTTDDASAFALAISNPTAYFDNFFIEGDVSGDVDDDGDLDFDDIDDFVSKVPGLTVAFVAKEIRRLSLVPEPGSIALVLLGSILSMICVRRSQRCSTND